jgi:hypothetical protein
VDVECLGDSNHREGAELGKAKAQRPAIGRTEEGRWKRRRTEIDSPVRPPQFELASERIPAHAFLSWYTIYERVSDCQATSWHAETAFSASYSNIVSEAWIHLIAGAVWKNQEFTQAEIRIDERNYGHS